MYKRVLWAIRAVSLLHLKEKGYGSISVIKTERTRGGSQRERSGFNLLSVQSPRDVGVAILPKQNWIEENRLEAVSQMCELMVAQLIFEIAGRVRIIGTFTGTFLPGFYSSDPIKTHTVQQLLVTTKLQEHVREGKGRAVGRYGAAGIFFG